MGSLQYILKNILCGTVWGFFNVLNKSCAGIGLGWVLSFCNSKEIDKICTRSQMQSRKRHRAKVCKYKAEQFRCDRPLISVTAQTLFPLRVLTSVSSFCSCQFCHSLSVWEGYTGVWDSKLLFLQWWHLFLVGVYHFSSRWPRERHVGDICTLTTRTNQP